MTDYLVIIDYGMGNLWSIQNALNFLGVNNKISSDKEIISSADAIILPGVGSFRKAMLSLTELDLVEVIRDLVLEEKKKILGICLGMQLFAEIGFEDGETKGLGLIKGQVKRLKINNDIQKLPHIGFNKVRSGNKSRMFKGIKNSSDFYFVHSYYLNHQEDNLEESICNHGIDFLAAFEHNNMFATQFHPEKSQSNGLVLLNNFIKSRC